MKAKRFKVGDRVRIIKIPPHVTDAAEIGTAALFKQVLGKTFRIEGFDDHGNLGLVVRERRLSPNKYQSDTVWIEPEFVVPVKS